MLTLIQTFSEFKNVQIPEKPVLTLHGCSNTSLILLISPTHHCDAQRWNILLFSKFISDPDGSIKSSADREDHSGIRVSFSVTAGGKQKLVSRKDAGIISKHQIFSTETENPQRVYGPSTATPTSALPPF